MAPIDLEGETLGERHRHFNKLVEEAIKQPSKQNKINHDDSDIENLMKIDISSRNRDLDYILDVMRGDDMLYVSRVLRNGAWLMEPQYAHIFNPEYLHAELIPTMSVRAAHKLLLYIRLHLKDEARVDQFYLYFENKDLQHAFKWLPRCSFSVAEQAVEKHQQVINIETMKRLCERSIKFLDIFTRANPCNYNVERTLKATRFLLNTDTEMYLNLIESISNFSWYGPKFGPKATSLIMKKFPERIFDKFEKYNRLIDLQTVSKHMKQEDIKGFLVKQMANKQVNLHFDNLKLFLRRLPEEGRFEFIKKVFIDKEEVEAATEDDKDVELEDLCVKRVTKKRNIIAKSMCYASASISVSKLNSSNVYKWYRFATFETAFLELKKLLRAESSPSERNAIMAVLLTCAARNPHHVHTLLQFYQGNHGNEPFKFKIHFINQVLSKTDTHKYDAQTWDILNNIFRSMEVYTESDNDVSSCVRSIIVYKTLHGEEIPEIIEKKFNFSTLKSLAQKLKSQESEKVFSYLYGYLEKKLHSKNLSDKEEFSDAIEILENLRSLIKDWKRDPTAYPLVQLKATELVTVMKDKGWTTEFSSLYSKNNWWRRQLFAQSVALRPCEETLLNALKHQPALLEQHEQAVQELCQDDRITLCRLLSKLRVYWPHSRAREWIAAYRARLGTADNGHRALVSGLCALLPPKELLLILRQHAPQTTKIEWATEDDNELRLRKNLAKTMHQARPPPPLEVALLYARGDYLQFALPSLIALAHDLSVPAAREALPAFLEAPVSLRKHGLRLAFAKLPAHELKSMFLRVWNTTKNSSIRTVVFKKTFLLLCREERPELIQELWELMSLFIDSLTLEENKEIYETLGTVKKVPVEVRGAFCVMSFRFLKTLPAKANCEEIISGLVFSTRDLMETLDYDFLINDIIPFVEEKLKTDEWHAYLGLISAFLLSAPDEQSQDMRYKSVLLPLLEKSFVEWDKRYSGSKRFTSEIIQSLLEQLCGDVKAYVWEKCMLVPVKMFAEIQEQIEKNLEVESNYTMLTVWKLTARFVSILGKQEEVTERDRKPEKCGGAGSCERQNSEWKWDQVLMKICPEFSESLLLYLKEDLDMYFPSVYRLFGKSLKDMIHDIGFSFHATLAMQKNILCEQCIPSYLVALNLMPDYYSDEEKGTLKEIREKIASHPSQEVKMHFYRKYKRNT